MQNNFEVAPMRERLLTTPASIFSHLIADVQHARESIDMEYYILADDRIGGVVANLLRRKVRQGVRVRLLVDGFGSWRMSRQQRKTLLMAGVEIKSYPLLGHRRNHRKMAIIDGRIAHIGGVNIADRYVVGDNLGPWYDIQLRFEGEGVSMLAALFDYDYLISDGLKCEVPMCYTTPRLSLVWSESMGRRAMPELFDEVVAAAHREIVLTTPYFIPPEGITSQLQRAISRGVTVQLLVPERCGLWLVDDIIHHHIIEARRAGIDVRLCSKMFLHAKIAMVDRRRVVVGSANLDARSMFINRELMAISSNKAVVAQAEEFIQRIMAKSVALDEARLHRRIPRLVGRIIERVL